MRYGTIWFVALVLFVPLTSIAGDDDPRSILSFAPPNMSRLLRLLEYVEEPSVIRHRVIAIDIDELKKAIETLDRRTDGAVSAPVLFPLFDDVTFTVRFEYTHRLGSHGWLALFSGSASDESGKYLGKVSGDLELTTESGEVLASFGWKHRMFAIHFTGEGPYHLAVENDPNHMPALD